jgi:hypothetical protein
MFEGVECVVVDKNADGPLHREQVRRVADRLAQLIPPLRRSAVPNPRALDTHYLQAHDHFSL